jgi:hypothetical protein
VRKITDFVLEAKMASNFSGMWYQFRGSSSLLGKHSNTIIMDFLASTATQSAFDRLDLIDAKT